MIVTTMNEIAGRMTGETKGMVRGTATWVRRIHKTYAGGIRALQSTGVSEFDLAMAAARESAERSMKAEAMALGADAIVGVKVEMAELSSGGFMLSMIGTAVRTVELPAAAPVLAGAANPDPKLNPEIADLAGKPSIEGSHLRH
jgi:uncharacterized protein YbjQ (UPF0145 family)